MNPSSPQEPIDPLTPQTPDAPKASSASGFPRWLAAVPALIIVTIFAGRAVVQMGMASRVINGDNGAKATQSMTCVETYGLNLANSEFYVPEGQQFQPRKTIQISTVLTGMVRNNCGEPLKSVSIHIKVRDDEGKRGDGWVTVSPLNSGEAKQFSKAWMGRISSYEIAKIQ